MNLKMVDIFSAIKSQHIHYTTTIYSYSDLVKVNNLILMMLKPLTIIKILPIFIGR